MDNLLTQKTPTALAIAQAVGITGSVFLLGEINLAMKNAFRNSNNAIMCMTCKIMTDKLHQEATSRSP
jgi:hypothetical protein